MHVAALQYDIIWEDKPANHHQIEAMIDDAALPAGTFLLLPELTDTGFSFNLDAIVDDRTLDWARNLACRREMWIQVGFAIREGDAKGLNRAAIINPDGDVQGVYDKLHPFSYGREAEHYEGGSHLTILTCHLNEAETANVAPLICYDLRFPEVWRIATLGGAEVFMIGASWPNARQHHWRALAIARAIENQAYVIACNRVGSDPHLSYDGGSIVISPTGDVIAEAGIEPAVIHADLDLEGLRDWRARFPALSDIRPKALGTLPICTD